MSPRKLTVLVGFLTALTAGALVVGCLYFKSPLTTEDEFRRDYFPPANRNRLTEVTPEIRDLVNSNNHFALDLYARLAAEEQDKNLFFSPYSVSSALAMVAEGARGETAEQMGEVLRYPQAARQKGDDARLLPWDMARIHTSMAALNDHFTSGSQDAPKEFRDHLAGLHKRLAAANQRVKVFEGKRQFDEALAEAEKAEQIAESINKLQIRYDKYEMRIANALWGEKSYEFKKSYFDALAKYYHTGGFFPVDFRHDIEGTRQRINAWVEDQTHQRIKDMIPKDALGQEVKELVRLILTNAIYFKGEWAEVFQPGQTKDDDFTLAEGQKLRVPMMHHNDMESASYAAFQGDGEFFNTPSDVPRGEVNPITVYPDERGFTLLELPYKGNEVSMVLIVPRSANGLAALEKKMTAATLQKWVGKLQQRAVHVFVPRFKLETKYALDQTLQAMGMVRAFKDPRAADGAQFDGMSESEDPARKLYISKVLHKAFVEVNEKGTEAAAATAISMASGAVLPSSVPFTPTFKADRPFVFLIRDVKTGSILFLGRMTNPKQH